MDVLLDALGYQARQPHQEDVSTSSTDAHKELLECTVPGDVPETLIGSRFVRRVSMVGVSGSGKSTVGKELARRLAVPYVELDAIFHQPGWTPLPAEQFRRRVTAIASGDGWVIDGNYTAVLPLVWERADSVVWLDLPRRTVMRRIIWRSVRRVAGRAELWNGNRERWRNLLTWNEQESVISWAWHHHPIYRQRYAAAANDRGNAHLMFDRIATSADARRLLDSARQPCPSGEG